MNDDFINILMANGIERSVAEKMNDFADILVAENEKYNLTAITDYPSMAYLHFLDSVYHMDQIIRAEGTVKIMDIGTGGGFPAVPLAICFSNTEITALDATEKKTRFLTNACDRLKISNVRAINGRAEILSRSDEYSARYDMIISRAVASLPVILEIGCRFLKTGGVAVIYKGPGYEEEIKNAEKAIDVLGFTLKEAVKTELNDMDHYLIILEKKKETPHKYPRSFSKIAKHHL